MNLKDIIRANKDKIEIGDWRQGHIPRSQFPMSMLKEKRYRFGQAYQWQIIKFQIDERAFRILVLLNEDKGIFRARLGVEDNGDMKVMCDHEWHASEPGWHCHINRKSVDSTVSGQVRSGT